MERENLENLINNITSMLPKSLKSFDSAILSADVEKTVLKCKRMTGVGFDEEKIVEALREELSGRPKRYVRSIIEATKPLRIVNNS